MGHHAMHLARRINLLHLRMERPDLEVLQEMPVVPYPSALLELQTIDEISEKLSELYLYYLLWRESDGFLNDELKDLQTWLKHILTMEGARLNWLADWVNVNGEIAGVSLADFWEDLDPNPDDVAVAPAFTQNGRVAVDGYLDEIERALFEPLAIGSRKLDFKNWYARGYVSAWSTFATRFPSAPMGLKDRAQWKQAGALMPSEKGPYLALLDYMADQLNVVAQEKDLPEWVDLVFRFKQVRIQAKTDGKGAKAAAGILDKATQTVNPKSAGPEAGPGPISPVASVLKTALQQATPSTIINRPCMV
jgi:type VI secretion system protein ImpL